MVKTFRSLGDLRHITDIFGPFEMKVRTMPQPFRRGSSPCSTSARSARSRDRRYFPWLYMGECFSAPPPPVTSAHQKTGCTTLRCAMGTRAAVNGSTDTRQQLWWIPIPS